MKRAKKILTTYIDKAFNNPSFYFIVTEAAVDCTGNLGSSLEDFNYVSYIEYYDAAIQMWRWKFRS